MGSDDEDYVALGTPLEPLEEEDALARKKPVAIQDQIVTDENGRRRFHGAFTGGFSAGYYNTVGSKEGWTPATFKSTRKDRKAIAAQSTKDFMDEEDIGAFGIAPQTLRPTEDFDTKKVEKSKRPRLAQSSGPIPGEPVLFKIIQPVTESMGVKVLRKMGWRPGQGVGPKFRKKKKKKRDNNETAELEQAAPEEGADDSSARIYGCSLPPRQTKGGSDSSDSDASDESIPTSLLAPDDVHCPLYNPKENRFGLGYQGLDRSSVFSGRVDLFGPSLQFRVENKKMDIAGEAFGIGVFEDADEEVYSRDDMTQYDFALETPEEKKRRMKQEAREKRKNKKSTGSALPGFVAAKIVDVPRKYYPPPQLPPGYVPVHGVKKSRFSQPERREEDAKADEVRRQGLDRHQLSRDERRVLLEDNSATKEPPKTISFTSGGTQVDAEEPTPAATPQPPVKETPKPVVDSAARMERLKKFAEVLQAYSSSKTKLSQDTFQPFSKHPGKQERYEKYLTLKAAGYGECLKDLQPPEMTEWEREREKMEFERASSLYKPLAGEMSSRFVTAKSHDISHLVPDKEKEKEKDPTQDPKVAAKMCLFGRLTHKVEEWHPDRLVCKRFNVPHPYPNSKMVGVRKETEAPKAESESMETDESVAEEAAPKKSLFANLDFSKPPPGLPPPGESVPSSSAVKEWPQLDFQKAQAESEAAPEEEASPPKPPIDLFKQIFADTSESEEETEEAEKSIQTTTSSSSKASDPKSSQDKPLSLQSSADTDTKLKQEASKGAGIFQNLDLDKLSSKPTASLSLTDPSKSTTRIKRMTAAEAFDDTEDEPIYGPAAPALLTPRSKANPSSQSHTFSSAKTTSTSSIPATSEVWIEKGAKESSKKKKKKHKKEHKSHHKVKKNKKKSSKHKKHKQKLKKTPSKSRHNKDPLGSSSSSSSDSDDGDDSGGTSTDFDVPQISEKNRAIIETLKRLL